MQRQTGGETLCSPECSIATIRSINCYLIEIVQNNIMYIDPDRGSSTPALAAQSWLSNCLEIYLLPATCCAFSQLSQANQDNMNQLPDGRSIPRINTQMAAQYHESILRWPHNITNQSTDGRTISRINPQMAAQYHESILRWQHNTTNQYSDGRTIS